METYKKEFQHWQYEFDPDDVLMLKLDRQNSAVNSLDQQILAELDQLLTALIALELFQQTHLPRALIIYSGKKMGSLPVLISLNLPTLKHTPTFSHSCYKRNKY